MRKNKRWTKEEEDLLIKLRELGYTYKQISIEIGRSTESCFKKYKRLTDPKTQEYYKQYQKQYYQDNKKKIAEYQKQYHKQYRQDNRDKIIEYNKQYYQDNRDKIKQYYQNNREKIKQYRQDNKDKYLEYQKQYYQDNREKILEHQRKYYAQNPHKTTRKERYDGEFADRQLCYEFYKGISPITGTKNDLQVHHLVSIKSNRDFWESATPEIKINYLILIPKDLHMSYHIWLGGTKVESTPESFWEFIDTVYFNEK